MFIPTYWSIFITRCATFPAPSVFSFIPWLLINFFYVHFPLLKLIDFWTIYRSQVMICPIINFSATNNQICEIYCDKKVKNQVLNRIQFSHKLFSQISSKNWISIFSLIWYFSSSTTFLSIELFGVNDTASWKINPINRKSPLLSIIFSTQTLSRKSFKNEYWKLENFKNYYNDKY